MSKPSITISNSSCYQQGVTNKKSIRVRSYGVEKPVKLREILEGLAIAAFWGGLTVLVLQTVYQAINLAGV